jgi:hypothetical protein
VLIARVVASLHWILAEALLASVKQSSGRLVARQAPTGAREKLVAELRTGSVVVHNFEPAAPERRRDLIAAGLLILVQGPPFRRLALTI